MEQTELDLIEGLKSGDEKTFETVFKKYYPVLSVFAKKYVYDLEISKEIVQDLFVKLFDNREKLHITTSLKSYLFQSVKNKCLTHLSQNQNQARHLENMAVLNKSHAIDDVDYVVQTELEEMIFKSISNLPEQCQRIFRMNRLEGKRNKEIAEDLHISIRTVETQISKALKILRESLEKYSLAIIVLAFIFFVF